jgi:hypothetical protein
VRVAFVVSSVVPLLVVLVVVLPTHQSGILQVLVVLTIVGMLAGAWVIWEINTFASRLDAAFKELESTNARLKVTEFEDDITGLYNRRFLLRRLAERLISAAEAVLRRGLPAD